MGYFLFIMFMVACGALIVALLSAMLWELVLEPMAEKHGVRRTILVTVSGLATWVAISAGIWMGVQ